MANSGKRSDWSREDRCQLARAFRRLAPPSNRFGQQSSSLIKPTDYHTSQTTERNQSKMCQRIRSSDRKMDRGLAVLVATASLSVLILAATIEAQQSTSKIGHAIGKVAQPVATTAAQSESIKWSFGGWAPLNGLLNSTNAQQSASSNTRQASATSPLPFNRTERSREALSESASNDHERLHLASPQEARAPHDHQHHGLVLSQGVQQPAQHHHHHHQVAPYHHEAASGPSHAFTHAQRPLQPAQLPMQQQQSSRVAQFSAPAPPAIVREQLLPASNNLHQARPMHHFAPQLAYPPRPMHMQQHAERPSHTMMQHPRQHHGRLMRPPMVQGPRAEHQRRMREMELRHRHEAMRHHHMMMRHQQHQHPSMHMHNEASHPAAAQRPHPSHQQPTVIHQHQLRALGANVGAYKLIDGEHPIIFNGPQQEGNSIRMIELGGNQHPRGHQNMSALSSPMNAIEKDNLNYQQYMQQVSKSLAEEAQRSQSARAQSNNIQEVKQRQLYEQQQQQYPKHENASSKAPYLTVPVAVETDGDKVLTPEDINEIEKHVINVLPNLHTADKIVKIADTRLNLANIEGAVQQVQEAAANAPASPSSQRQLAQPASGPELSQMNYAEHKSTMKQLEGDLKQQRDYSRPTSAAVAQSSRSQGPAQSSSAGVSQATTANAQHQTAPEHMLDGQQEQQMHLNLDEQQYFIATGPMQELGSVDPEQVADYNLIKNDLLSKFHYEPTRAGASAGRQQQQTASTPPMPYTASHPSSGRPSSTSPTVARYFHQGRLTEPTNYAQRQQNQRDQLFGRLRQPNGGGYQQQTSSTRTMMGGRKVSEIMRPLIHTTPIPMSTPLHVPSVEPEKVDAIQFIAGQAANDKQPMVVEAHQLVSHTPDGGIDYSTGMAPPSAQHHHQQQQQQRQQQPMQHQANQSYHEMSQEQPQQHQYVPQANPNEENQPGAIIEYVSISDQALSNALNQQQQSTPGAQQQNYAISSAPEMQPVYVNAEQQQQSASPQAPFLYAYSMADQQQVNGQHTGDTSHQQQTTPTYGMSSVTTEHPQVVLVEHQPQQPESVQQPSLPWSSSVASEHQQQQQPLEMAGPMQQLELPATAGYNLFGQPEQQQQQSTPSGQEYEQQQQQQQEPESEHHSKWRTRAGGRQPNPDAQYDGQIPKAQGQEESSVAGEEGQRQEDKSEQQQQQADEQQQYASGYSQQPQQHVVELTRLDGQQGPEKEQQQDQSDYEQHSSTAPAGQPTTRDQYDASTSAFHGAVGGAQLNHDMASHYSRPQQQAYGQMASSAPIEQQTATTPYRYAKLDRERQQSHLAEQQVQHQAQLADLMQNQQQQQQQDVEQQPQQYQTTSTPLTLTTVATAIAQQQQQAEQQQQQYEGESSTQSGENSQALLINPSAPIHVPIMDQQSLINDQEGGQQEEALTGSSDDGARQRQQSQPAAVYQVYQAYYAPKDHKPLPGYVRLSLEEFNELFKDAEIQFVDKNLNGLAKNLVNQQQQNELAAYNENGQQYDHMRTSGSEQQTIVVDRRSIADRRIDSANINSNATTTAQRQSIKPSAERTLKHLGQAAVKKVISIRNSRQTSIKHPLGTGIKSSKGVSKRVKAGTLQENKPNASKTGVISSTTAASASTGGSTSPNPSTESPSTAKSAKKQALAKGGSKKATSQREPKRATIKS